MADEIRTAPPGTFEELEKGDASFELEQTLWTALANRRPQLHSALRKAKARVNG